MRPSPLALACLLGLAAAFPQGFSKGKGSDSYVSTTYPQGPCQPGSRVKYLCNDCNCDRNGLGYTCTRRDCGNQGPNGPQISPPRPGPGGPQVSPPKPYPGGPQVSPPRPNPDRPQISPPRPYPEGPQISPPRPYPEGPQISPPKPRECVPGSSYSPDGCNTCRCTSGGIPLCTKKSCGNRCTPGLSWNDGCNSCTCTSTGSQICTQKACIPRPPPPAKNGRN